VLAPSVTGRPRLARGFLSLLHDLRNRKAPPVRAGLMALTIYAAVVAHGI
jgi:hypothetical protein